MPFSTYETSRQKGGPITLYLFTYGTDETASPTTSLIYAYTDAETSISYGGNTYSPIPIQRGAVNASGQLDKTTLQITLQKDASIVDQFQIYPPSTPITLVIRQGHVDDASLEFPVVWSGRVLGGGREDNEFVLACEPISSTLRRPGLRRNYQIGCPHVLYSTECGASEAAATVTGTVASTSGLTVTLNSGWNGAFTNTKFIGGKVKWLNDDGAYEIRRVLNVSSDTLTLGGYIRDLVATDSISVILGCNHQQGISDSTGDCNNLHSNIQNYGGCDWIPTQNPVGTYNNFY